MIVTIDESVDQLTTFLPKTCQILAHSDLNLHKELDKALPKSYNFKNKVAVVTLPILHSFVIK